MVVMIPPEITLVLIQCYSPKIERYMMKKVTFRKSIVGGDMIMIRYAGCNVSAKCCDDCLGGGTGLQ